MITAKTSIEEIVAKGSELVQYLSEKGIRCIRCGEPIWGTLEEAAISKGFSEKNIEEFVNELNDILNKNNSYE